jgi:hypothetical protein
VAQEILAFQRVECLVKKYSVEILIPFQLAAPHLRAKIIYLN